MFVPYKSIFRTNMYIYICMILPIYCNLFYAIVTARTAFKLAYVLCASISLGRTYYQKNKPICRRLCDKMHSIITRGQFWPSGIVVVGMWG